MNERLWLISRFRAPTLPSWRSARCRRKIKCTGYIRVLKQAAVRNRLGPVGARGQWRRLGDLEEASRSIGPLPSNCGAELRLL